MRRLIEGDNQIAKLGAVKKIRQLVKGPTKDKLSSLVKAKQPHPIIKDGVELSSMSKFLPGTQDNAETEHQRLKLGEVNPSKKKKEEDEE